MLFKKKSKQLPKVNIDDIKFISDDAKNAFKILEIENTDQLVGKEAENLYLDYCVESGGVADRCILFEMRCVMYYATTAKPDPKKLRWWYWKDSNINNNEDIIDE